MTDLEITGGAAGLEVRFDELHRTAALLGRTGAGVLALAAARHRMLGDGDLVASAALDPAGFARVEAAVLTALDGRCGLTAAGGRLVLRAGQLALAVLRYEAADRLDSGLDEVRHWLLGTAGLAALPAVVLGGAAWFAATTLSGGDPAADLDRFLTDHPGVLDEVLTAVPAATAPLRRGLAGPLPLLGDTVFRAVTGEAVLPRDLSESAGLMAMLYEPARPAVSEGRVDPDPLAKAVPGGIGDLLRGLDRRNDLADSSGATQGDIGVTRIVTTATDGRQVVSYVVDLPGTKDWQLTPGAPRPYVNDLATNLELMAGEDNARLEALRQVLAQAGVQPGEPVMLVGHSQGGMLAVRAATELGGRYAITHVVTAGSPVGGMPVPPRTEVLSLENAHDLVPHLDGRENGDGAHHTTVVFDAQHGSAGENHSTTTSYVPGAAALDLALERGQAGAVQVWLDSAGAFFGGQGETHAVSTTVFGVGPRVAR